MQTLEDQLQEVTERVAYVKDAVKEGAKDFERLRVERAEAEKEMKVSRDEVEDGRAAGLYDWYVFNTRVSCQMIIIICRYTASLAFHRLLVSLESVKPISANELHLTYRMLNAGAKSSGIIIILLFLPNTRQLADARVEGLDALDIANMVSPFVQANDVS